MSGIFSYRMTQAIRSGAPLCLLAEVDHPDGMFRCWTGVGELEYGGYTWTGIGNLGRVGPARYSVELSIQDVSLVLSGVDEATLALLSGLVRNRPAFVWIAALDDRTKIIERHELLDLQLDYQSFQAAADGECSVVLTARSGFYTLERAINDCWTDEDQKVRFPVSDDGGDTGCALIGALQNKETIWVAA